MFWYRLVIGGLNLRDADGKAHRCPHEFCGSTSDETLQHILWDCEGARQFWDELLWRWAQLRLRDDHAHDSAFDAIFSRTAPTARTALLQQTAAAAEDYAQIHRTLDVLWEVVCTAAAQHLWLTRNEAVFQDLTISAQGVAKRTWVAVSTQVQALGAPSRRDFEELQRERLIGTFWTALKGDLRDDHSSDTIARLYFDGGSRGNPGRAGCGAVLVERESSGADWRVVWWSAHFLGDAATNNEAEHEALSRGVAESTRRYAGTGTRLTIIGDSQLILGQVAGHLRSTQHNTNRAARQTRRALRDLPATTLRHTLRAGNKMADWLANEAMNTRRSTNALTTWGPTDIALTSLLPTDIDHPTSPLQRPHTLLPQLSKQLQLAEGRLQAHRKRKRIE